MHFILLLPWSILPEYPIQCPCGTLRSHVVIIIITVHCIVCDCHIHYTIHSPSLSLSDRNISTLCSTTKHNPYVRSTRTYHFGEQKEESGGREEERLAYVDRLLLCWCVLKVQLGIKFNLHTYFEDDHLRTGNTVYPSLFALPYFTCQSAIHCTSSFKGTLWPMEEYQRKSLPSTCMVGMERKKLYRFE